MARLVAAWIVGAAAWSLRLARVGAGRGIGVNQQYCADLLAPCYLMDYEDAFGEMFCDRPIVPGANMMSEEGDLAEIAAPKEMRALEVRRNNGTHSVLLQCGTGTYVPGEKLSVSIVAPKDESRESNHIFVVAESSAKKGAKKRPKAQRVRFDGDDAVCGGARVMGRWVPDWLRAPGTDDNELNARVRLKTPPARAEGDGDGELALVAAWANRVGVALLTKPCLLRPEPTPPPVADDAAAEAAAQQPSGEL